MSNVTGAIEDIKNFAKNRLNKEFGFCGVAELMDQVVLISGNDAFQTRITIDLTNMQPDSNKG